MLSPVALLALLLLLLLEARGQDGDGSVPQQQQFHRDNAAAWIENDTDGIGEMLGTTACISLLQDDSCDTLGEDPEEISFLVPLGKDGFGIHVGYNGAEAEDGAQHVDVSALVPDSTGARSGMQVGDQILAVNGHPIGSK